MRLLSSGRDHRWFPLLSMNNNWELLEECARGPAWGRHPSEMHLKLNSREVSIADNVFCRCPIVSNFCTEHGSITALLSAKYQNNWTTETDVMDVRDFAGFEFMVLLSLSIFRLMLTMLDGIIFFSHSARGCFVSINELWIFTVFHFRGWSGVTHAVANIVSEIRSTKMYLASVLTPHTHTHTHTLQCH